MPSFWAIDLALWSAGALLLVGLVKGATGIGAPLVGVPLLSMTMDVRRAVILLAVPIVLTNFKQAFEKVELPPQAMRQIIHVSLGFLPGVAIGSYLLCVISASNALIIAGGSLLICLLVQTTAAKRINANNVLHSARLAAFFGTVSGITGGLSGVAGPFAFVYFLSFRPSPAQFTRMASIFLIVATVLLTACLGGSGPIDGSDIILSLVLSVPAFIGLFAGERLRKLISPSTFRIIILCLIALGASDMVRRGLSVVDHTTPTKADRLAEAHELPALLGTHRTTFGRLSFLRAPGVPRD